MERVEGGYDDLERGLKSGEFWVQVVDVAILGATPSGSLAAIAARRYSNASVLVMEQNGFVGGALYGGMIDDSVLGVPGTYGGLALEFYERIAVYYGNGGNGSSFCAHAEPHVYDLVLSTWLREEGVVVWRNASLCGVERGNGGMGGVESMRACDGRVVEGRFFIDATYEGDLLSKAGVPVALGREPASMWNESMAGVQDPSLECPNFGFHGHKLSPYTDPSSPTPTLQSLVCFGEDESCPMNGGVAGSGDGLVQSYNMRGCFTTDASRGVSLAVEPEGYNASVWTFLEDWIRAEGDGDLVGCTSINHGSKCDINDNGPVSVNPVGMQWKWPVLTHSQRLELLHKHRQYTASFFYYLHSRNQEQEETGEEGGVLSLSASATSLYLCADEYNETAHWPPTTYVREGRRMMSDSVFTQNDFMAQAGGRGYPTTPRGILPTATNVSIGLGTWFVDSHVVQRVPANRTSSEGTATTPWTFNEGCVQYGRGVTSSFAIPFSILLPPPPSTQLPPHSHPDAVETEEDFVNAQGKSLLLTNPLLAPPQNVAASVAVSSTHIGFNPLRIEPTYMVMGQAAGTAAAIAVQSNVSSFRQVPPQTLTDALRKANAVLERDQIFTPPTNVCG